MPTNNLNALRAQKTNDNCHISTLENLKEIVRQIEEGEIEEPQHSMIIGLNTVGKNGEEKFDAQYWAAQIKNSQMVSLLECIKAMVIADMGYSERDE